MYLHHFVDRHWSTSHPQVELLRYVDDFLLLGSTADTVNQSHRSLVEQLRVAGLAVKRAEAQAIDLASGVACHWLGFTIHWRDGRLIYDLPSDWQDEMRASLTNCHSRAYSTENARASILGWCRAYGPVWATTGRRSVYRELVTLAADCGFREIPAAHEFAEACRKASHAWRRLRQASGLAGAERDLPTSRRPQVASAPNLSRSGREWHLVTDGSCLPDGGVGGCAFELTDYSHRPIRKSYAARRTTNNRAELKAVILGLRQLPDGTKVQLTTDSAYVAQAVNRGIARWRANQWRTRRNRPVKNLDLMQELWAELQRCTVRAVRIAGHSGDPANDRVDRAANRAARMLQRRLFPD